MRSRTESILVVVAALVWGAAAAHSPIDIQPVPGSIHEIGYVCLEEVNPTSYPCGGVDLISRTTSDEEERVQSQEQTPVPNWMKRSDGQALTWKEVKQLKSAMYEHDEVRRYGAKQLPHDVCNSTSRLSVSRKNLSSVL